MHNLTLAVALVSSTIGCAKRAAPHGESAAHVKSIMQAVDARLAARPTLPACAAKAARTAETMTAEAVHRLATGASSGADEPQFGPTDNRSGMLWLVTASSPGIADMAADRLIKSDKWLVSAVDDLVPAKIAGSSFDSGTITGHVVQVSSKDGALECQWTFTAKNGDLVDYQHVEDPLHPEKQQDELRWRLESNLYSQAGYAASSAVF